MHPVQACPNPSLSSLSLSVPLCSIPCVPCVLFVSCVANFFIAAHPVDLSHFTLLRSVGKGAFGKVRVVQHKGTKQLYALKYINKNKCIQMRAVENIISERRILEQVSHALIVNLRYAFQDDENLFMVLDLMLGGDLRFHLDRLNVMPEPYVRFYVAQVALGLHHLHQNSVVHRDIKPDNILLDNLGHAHLTDFNIAVQFSETKALTSVAGSMAYMAPEVLQKRGYFSSVDWWSLGVVCFELLFGKVKHIIFMHEACMCLHCVSICYYCCIVLYILTQLHVSL